MSSFAFEWRGAYRWILKFTGGRIWENGYEDAHGVVSRSGSEASRALFSQSLRCSDPRVLRQGPSDKVVHLTWKKGIVPTRWNLTKWKWQEIQEAPVPHWGLQRWQTGEYQSSVPCLFLPWWRHISLWKHAVLFRWNKFSFLRHETYNQKIKPSGRYTKKLCKNLRSTIWPPIHCFLLFCFPGSSLTIVPSQQEAM